jgi:hypothetical protein
VLGYTAYETIATAIVILASTLFVEEIETPRSASYIISFQSMNVGMSVFVSRTVNTKCRLLLRSVIAS